MPQQRTLLHTGAEWTVERVRWHAAPVQWSAAYQAASSRWVLPTDGVLEFQLDGQAVLLDGLTALGLPQGLPYQMRPLQPTAQTSVVVSARPGTSGLAAPQVRALSPRALWQLRAPGHSAQVLQALAPGVPTLAPAAVVRARRFMALRVGAACGERWSLHDVADAAGCSPFHLAHFFRRHVGQRLHGYRQRLRMAAALQRLEAGEADLAALAHDLGYCSQSHLGAVFRREVGVTLAQARAALRAGI